MTHFDSFGLLLELAEAAQDLTLPQLEKALEAAPQLSKRAEAMERSPQVVKVMDRCLCLEPSERPSAQQVASEL